jgi:hypothetical protein
MATMSPTRPEVAPAAPAHDPRFAVPADSSTVERTAAALRVKGYTVFIAEDRETARRLILEQIPEGAEVSQGGSITLDELGITAEIETSGRYDAVRPRARAVDRSTAEGRREGRKLGASPDYWLSSAQAVTEDGVIVLASSTGSQLGPIAFGAGAVVFAIGAQKIVPDLDAALERIRTYSLPFEDVRMREMYGVGSAVNKTMIIDREWRPERFTIVIIREPVGV